MTGPNQNRKAARGSPLFIIGMPRSGTKLVRAILSEHPVIFIPDIETEFLPRWVRRWDTFGRLADRKMFQRFYDRQLSIPYFVYMRERNKLISADTWFEACTGFTVADVFEALLRHDSGAGAQHDRLWGDKSPSYINHIPLLRTLYPNALFVHVIRDVRDHCLSIKQAWGKSMVRAAQRWVDGVEKARNDAKNCPRDYLEVTYERLTGSPEAEITRICQFLGLSFEPGMLELSVAPENLGSARGTRHVVSGAAGRYRTEMSRRTLLRIETIAADALRGLEYPVSVTGSSRRVGGLQMAIHQLWDGFQLVRSAVRQRGLKDSVRFHLRYFLVSGNRN